MKKILCQLFDIREGEGTRAILMFGYIFFIISSLLIVKPVRNSLFITRFGVSQLPYVYILVAFSAALVVQIYSGFAKKLSLNPLINGTTVISILCLLFFWFLLDYDYQATWFFYFFYVWVAIFGVISASQFWLMANEIFNVREAKRLFGFLGAGAISGGIFGGYLTNFLAPYVGTKNLVIICIGFLTFCLFIIQLIKRNSRISHPQKSPAKIPFSQPAKKADSLFNILKKSKHLTLISGIVGVSVIAASLVDYQFSAIASENINDSDRLTAFFGFWLSNLSIISLLVQLILTRFILKTVGVAATLFFLPVGILLGSIAILLAPILFSAIVIKVADGCFKQSINKAGMELLVLPIPPNIKKQAKTFIDVFIDSLATGISGLLLILLTHQLGVPVRYISILTIGIIAIWLFLIIRTRGEYIQSFRLAIEKRTINLDEQTINLQDKSIFESLIRVLTGWNERQILYILYLIENVVEESFVPHFKRLLTGFKITPQTCRQLKKNNLPPELLSHLKTLVNHEFYDEEKFQTVIEKLAGTKWTPEYDRLLKSQVKYFSGDIKIQVLRLIRKYPNDDLVFEASGLIEDDNQEVQIEAIHYLYRHSIKKIDTLYKFLNHANIRVQAAVLLCVAQKFSEDGQIDKSLNIQELFNSRINLYRQARDEKQKEFIKITAAKVIGITRIKEFYRYLQLFLHDRSLAVRQSAVVNMGNTGAEDFLKILVQQLGDKSLRKYAREALSQYGEKAIPILVEQLNNSAASKPQRLEIPRVLALIPSQPTVNALLERLQQNNGFMDYETIKALNKLKTRFASLKFNKYEKHIEKKIAKETGNYNQIVKILDTQINLKNNSNQVGPADQALEKTLKAKMLLKKALIEKLDKNLELIFRLLGLRYQPDDMYFAFQGIKSKNNELRANAIEFLDNVLHPGLKRIIIPIIDTTAIGILIDERPDEQAGTPENIETLYLLLDGKDPWLKACTLYLLGRLKYSRAISKIKQSRLDPDPLVRETAEYALQRMNAALPNLENVSTKK